MQNKDVCCEQPETNSRGQGAGLLIVVVLYILLAIIFSPFTAR